MTAEAPDHAEFASRRKDAAALAAERGLAGLVVCSRGGGTLDRYGDVFYLSGYYTSFPYIPDLEGNWTGRAHCFLVLAASGDAILVTDIASDGGTAMPDDCVVTTDLVAEGVVAAMRDLGLDNAPVGLVGGDVLPVNLFRAIEGGMGGVRWSDAQDILAGLRSVKSPAEIDALRRASRLGSRVIEAMMAAAEPGARHGDVVAAGSSVLIPAGGMFYNSFMASGRGGHDPVYVRTNFPTWRSDARLEEGQWFRLGISGVLDGYFFDLSRSKAIGPATNRQIDLFEAAIGVVDAGISALVPGITAEEVASAGLGHQDRLGFSNDAVFRGLGHGVGLGWDKPWLAPGDRTVIEPGMVICVERTIRHDGYLGDFEETVLVTPDGPEKLTDATIRYW